MAKITIAEAIKRSNDNHAVLTDNQNDQFETLLGMMSPHEDATRLPNQIVAAGFEIASSNDDTESRRKAVFKSNMILKEGIDDLHDYFIDQRLNADTFALASSVAQTYIMKNPQRRVNGVLVRSNSMPDFGDRQVNQAKTIQYWLSYSDKDENKSDEQINTMLNTIERTLDGVFMINDASLRDEHWTSCYEKVLELFNDADGKGNKLYKTPVSVNNMVASFMKGIVDANNFYIHEIHRMAEEDIPNFNIIENKIGRPLLTKFIGNNEVSGLDVALEYNNKVITDLLEGWMLEDTEEEHKEAPEMNERPLQEGDYITHDEEGNLLDLSAPELNNDVHGLEG